MLIILWVLIWTHVKQCKENTFVLISQIRTLRSETFKSLAQQVGEQSRYSDFGACIPNTRPGFLLHIFRNIPLAVRTL